MIGLQIEDKLEDHRRDGPIRFETRNRPKQPCPWKRERMKWMSKGMNQNERKRLNGTARNARKLKVLRTNTKDVNHGNRRIKLSPTGKAVILNHTSFRMEVYYPGDEFLSLRMTNCAL